MKNIFFAILLSLPLVVFSQSPQPSWDLIPSDEPTSIIEFMPTDIVETKDDCYIASLMHHLGLPFDVKNTSRNKSNIARIVKFNDNGELLHEIELQHDSSYYIANMQFDICNDTINVFTLLTRLDGEHFVLMHAYLFEDMSMSEQSEIWRKDFNDGLVWRDMIGELDYLIDENGCRTFRFEYSTSMMLEDYILFVLKLDDKFSVVSESEYNRKDDLNNAIAISVPMTYNLDSTQYYYISYTTEYPYYYFMNVFDMDLNLQEQIPLESTPPTNLQGFDGYWGQNPYDGKIYAFGLVSTPNIKSEICAFKIDVDSEDVDFLRLSYSPDEIKNSIIIGKNLCFLPDGKIIGSALYDMDLYNMYKPNTYLAYMPVFDANMKKISEWYYTVGEMYNQYMYRIYTTKDNGVILLGYIRYMMDDEIYWEPYIVKFPASAFDTDNIEEAHAHGLHLALAYPNPGGNVMNIRTALRNATLQVYDMQGRKVHEQEITDDVTSIDASKWESGTYVWKLGTGNGNEVEGKVLESGKWVKE